MESRLAKLLLIAAILGLGACGGGISDDAGGTEKPVDTDGDGLSDADEAFFGTNPKVEDTDGDGFLDKEEVDNWDRFSGKHLRFNPLVADMPRIRIRQLGAPVIQLKATLKSGSEITKGMTNENSAEVKVTTNRGRSSTNVIEEQHAVSVNAEVEKRGPLPPRGKISASYDYQYIDTTTETAYWNKQTVKTNRQASSEYYELLRTEEIETKGGEISILMGVLNDGDISYTLENMNLAAFMENPQRPGNLESVGTLNFDGTMSFTPSLLDSAVNPSIDKYTPFNFVYSSDDPQKISRILESSSQLVLKPSNITLTGQRPDISLALAEQNIESRTAEVIIDFGDSQAIKTERYRVAVNTGDGNTLSFEDLMTNRLNFDYVFSTESFSESRQSYRGLSSVRSLAMNTNTNSYWLIAHTFSPPASPPKTTETILYNILNQDYSASDISLRRGDVLHLVYITDTDLDGLSDRLEVLKGTDLNNSDTDTDGLDDALEVYGWLTNLDSAPCGDGDELSLVFSNPSETDTDGDGVSDKDEFDQCSNPEGDLNVNVGDDLLVSQGDQVTLNAQPENYQSRDSLRYNWSQVSGVDVGDLPNSAEISFSAPNEVTNLQFNVTVTDTTQNNSASKRLSVFVAKDKDAAIFVEADLGHDFNNDGRTPNTPVKTIGRALENDFQGADVYLNTPDTGFFKINDTIELPATTNLYGGFDSDWVHDPDSPTPILVNQAVALSLEGFNNKSIVGISIKAEAPAGGTKNSHAIYVANGGNLILKNVIAQGSDLIVVKPADADIASYVAGSSYGVLAQGLTRLDLINSTISAGKAADGVQGLDGRKGKPGKGGGKTSSRFGAKGGSEHNGANGGRGGTAAVAAVCVGGENGNKGRDSHDSSGKRIDGGAGGSGGSVSFPCKKVKAKSGGSPKTRAETRADGAPAEHSVEFTDGIFAPSHGVSAGKQGRGGAGGGGGGAGLGHGGNNGGGGGGGGEGGEGGIGGNIGRGGGGSFGLVLSAVTFTSIKNSVISSSEGGKGGAGGTGGTGGEGGNGGTGGDSGNRKGGSGGKGGPGGHGSNGGGGAGGPVAAILLLQGGQLDLSTSQLVTGNAGNGMGTSPMRGQGGWNYGVFVDEGGTVNFAGMKPAQLGNVGNDVGSAAVTNLP